MAVSCLGHLPVRDADGGVHGKKSQKLLVENFIDAPLPGQKQLGEAAEASVRHTCCVRYCHLWVPAAVLLRTRSEPQALFCKVLHPGFMGMQNP